MIQVGVCSPVRYLGSNSQEWSSAASINSAAPPQFARSSRDDGRAEWLDARRCKRRGLVDGDLDGALPDRGHALNAVTGK